MPQREPTLVIICATADAKYMALGSTFDRRCARCAERVMLAPSGRKVAINTPGAEIICSACFALDLRDRKARKTAAPIKIQIAAELEVILGEIRDAVPNPYRVRN